MTRRSQQSHGNPTVTRRAGATNITDARPPLLASMRGKHIGSPHVTYLALSGGGDDVIHEAARSAFSLCLLTWNVSVLLVTNRPDLAAMAEDRLAAACARQHAARQVTVLNLPDETVLATLRRFNFTRMWGHHSGPGGFAKLVPTDWLPATVDRTLIVDTDTLFNDDATRLWRRGFRAFHRQQVAALTPFHKQGFGCVRTPMTQRLFNQRFNSGVQLLDVSKMRSSRWGEAVGDALGGIRRLPLEHGCSFFAQRDTLCVNDQELLSWSCVRNPRACGDLPPWAHVDGCGNANAPRARMGRGATIHHFNCQKPVGDWRCDQGCKAVLRSFRELVVKRGWRAEQRYDKRSVAAWQSKGRFAFAASDGGCIAAERAWTAFRRSPRARNFSGGHWLFQPTSIGSPEWKFVSWPKRR